MYGQVCIYIYRQVKERKKESWDECRMGNFRIEPLLSCIDKSRDKS